MRNLRAAVCNAARFRDKVTAVFSERIRAQRVHPSPSLSPAKSKPVLSGVEGGSGRTGRRYALLLQYLFAVSLSNHKQGCQPSREPSSYYTPPANGGKILSSIPSVRG